MFRFFIVLPIAALVTAGLFLMMYRMIQQDMRLTAAKPVETVVITAKRKLTEPKPDITNPAELDPPEPPELDIPTSDGPPDMPLELPDPGEIELPPGRVGGFTFTSPVISYPPVYPERCRAKGAEGLVTVEFDLTEQGDVVNPRILSSADSCFERTVLRNIVKWKFQPKIVDGKPVTQKGVRRVFRFELAD